ncbi:DUF397 domain-containing protein [Lentzea aerocolonigenes]|uniref:DUF397 domain-containing protein n=1 Tax=Lentzea aerocolonigenes TaxID=68170 RepID=UPI0009DCF5FD|nr:DUF397 domain-containing protein [Lentzea aerocolonigenes]MCP2241507.1 protein of unknown function (DUF397) [Lentzea aerocolonigenes]
MVEWRKSSYSATDSDCVEVGRRVGIRDSKAPATHLPVSPAAWTAFLRSVSNRGPA